MTVASLGFKIDSSQASSAAVDLEKLYAAAAKLDGAADSLTASAGALAGALKRVGDETKKIPPVARPFQNQDEHVKAFRAEIERLTTKYQPLAQATKNHEASISEINRAHQLGVINAQQMQKALDAERMAFERLKTSAMGANQAVVAANQNNASGAQRAAGVNAGYQFQDIAVTAAMGMNPLMIGLQQGTQLASVLATMERPVAGLAGAFMSMVSPISLVTIGLTAGTAALVQYFMAADDGADGMDADLRAQADLIMSVAERWGDLVPSVKEYADELTRAKDQAELLAGIDIVNQRKLEDTKTSLASATISVADLVSKLQDAGEETDVILNLQNAVNRFNEAAANGTVQFEQVKSVQDALSSALRSTGIPAISDFRTEFEKLSESAVKSSKDVAESWREIAAALTSRYPSQGVYGGVERSADGRVMGESIALPFNGPTPGGRPSDLARDPDIADSRILNSDGRLVGVPIPGQKPNFFELEKENEKVDDLTKAYRRAQEARADFWLDLSFAERQAGRSVMDQRIASTLTRYGFDENLQSPEADALRKQLREGEAKDLFKGFFSGVYQEAWSNGGKIGDAIVKSALNAAQKAAEKGWDAIFDSLAGKLGAWLTGGAGKSTGTVAAGFTPTTTLGAVLGAGGAANDNKTSASIPTTDIGAYIAQAAIKRGIDPKTALAVARSEGGLNSWNMQSQYVKNGVQEPSFGPYQLYMGGGLGNAFQKQTGLDPRLAANGPAGVDFALDHAAKNGWGAWYGAKNAGIGNFEGIGESAKAIQGLGEAAASTAKMTAGLGQTLASIPQALMAIGGGTGIFSGLTKYGMGLFSQSGQFASALMKGGVGLFANGTDYSRGGLSIVGDKGPELLNIPTGSGIMSNDKLAAALNDNRSSQSVKGQRPELKVYVQGANSDAQIRQMAQQGARDALVEYDKMLERGRFGNVQQDYQANKG